MMMVLGHFRLKPAGDIPKFSIFSTLYVRGLELWMAFFHVWTIKLVHLFTSIPTLPLPFKHAHGYTPTPMHIMLFSNTVWVNFLCSWTVLLSLLYCSCQICFWSVRHCSVALTSYCFLVKYFSFFCMMRYIALDNLDVVVFQADHGGTIPS